MEKQGERCALPRDSPPLQRGQDQVEIRYQRVQDAAEITSVQQVGDSAEQIAQQIAIARHRRDIEHDLIQMNRESKKV